MRHIIFAAVAFIIPLPLLAQLPRLSPEQALSVAPFDCYSAPLLACGDSKSASPSCLSSQYYVDVYTFNAIANQTLTITARTTTSYQMLVTVQESTGTILKSNYGAGPVTLTYTFSTAGTFYIGFGFIAPYAVGPYSLTLACTTATSQCVYAGSITIDSTTNVILTSADTLCAPDYSWSYFKVYKLVVSQGDAFTVSLQGQLAPYVEIDPRTMGGGFSAWKDGGTAALSYVSPIAQTVDVWVGSNTSTRTAGSMTLQIARESDGPCKHRAASH